MQEAALRARSTSLRVSRALSIAWCERWLAGRGWSDGVASVVVVGWASSTVARFRSAGMRADSVIRVAGGTGVGCVAAAGVSLVRDLFSFPLFFLLTPLST